MNSFHVVSLRGEVEDSSHIVHAAVCRADGEVVYDWGDSSMMVLTRSTAKPFQSIPVLRNGVLEKYGFGAKQLAAICSSHNSEQFQVDVVEKMLNAVGEPEERLVCVSHRPLIKDLGYHLTGDNAEIVLAPPGPLASNCSGKHTGMIALASELGCGVPGYEQTEHPVQIAGRQVLSEFCGIEESAVRGSLDGCGVVCWAVPLDGLALGYARLATSDEDAVVRVRDAMMQFPEIVAGSRRLCTALMKSAPGKIVAKIGAGGVYGAALVEQGLGVSIKVADGNSIAAGVALIGVLNALDPTLRLPELLAEYANPAVLNTRRAVVGHYELGDDLSLV